MAYILDGNIIRNPDSFVAGWFKLSDAGRTADGTMNMDIIALKRTFAFSYDVMSGTELDTILELLYSFDAFFTLEYDFNGEMKTATVYVGAISARKFRTGSLWYWKDISFQLIER